MANPPILFPDAAAVAIEWVRGFLEARGDTAEVHHKIPQDRPHRFVLIFRTGGPRHTVPVIDAAQLTVECWADTDAAASDLAQLVRAALGALAGDVVDGTTVYRADEFGGPADLPDPESHQSRQTWSVFALMRGADLESA